ncbi:hypothetical protein MD484_g5585, partial [Candolleomyces efflorescens]
MLYDKGLIAPPHPGQIRARTRIPESRSDLDLFSSIAWNEQTLLAECDGDDDDDPKLGLSPSSNTSTIRHHLHYRVVGTLKQLPCRRLATTFLLLLFSCVLLGLFVLEDRVHAALRFRGATDLPVSEGLDMGFGGLAFNETRDSTRNSTAGARSPSLNRFKAKKPGSPTSTGTRTDTNTKPAAGRRGYYSSTTLFRGGGTGRFPLIDRAMLASKLGGLSGYDDDRDDDKGWKDLEPELGSSENNAGSERRERTVTRRWPPMITRIPESSRPKKLYPPSPSTLPATPPRSIQPFLLDSELDNGCTPRSNSNSTDPDNSRPLACSPAVNGRRKPKFLLPLRIAEQESKARIHFLQLVQLAHRLDRVLVLPNVAKSRIGACYKWPFEVYYDTEEGFGLARDDEGQDDRVHGTDVGENGARTKHPKYITLDNFKLWSDYYSLRANKTGGIHSRLVSIASSLPDGIANSPSLSSSSSSSYPPSSSYSSSRVEPESIIHRYPTTLAPPTEFPGCFPSKFPHLSLDPTSLYVALDRQDPSLRATSPLEVDGESEFEFGQALVRGLRNATGSRRRRRVGTTGEGVDGPRIGAGLNEQEAMRPDDREEVGREGDGDGGEDEDEEPDVLVVNWDLRRPIFDLSSPPSTSPSSTSTSAPESVQVGAVPTTLPYSPHLQALSKLLSPRHEGNDGGEAPSEARAGVDGEGEVVLVGEGEAERKRHHPPYIAIHWRMETVPLSALEDCAYALIDTLSNILAEIELERELDEEGEAEAEVEEDDETEKEVTDEQAQRKSKQKPKTKIWFASDYPYPLRLSPLSSSSSSKPPLLPKSGTFKTFNVQHENAIQILKSAFESPMRSDELGNWELEAEGDRMVEGGELAEWAELVDISSSSSSSSIQMNATTTSGPWGDPTTVSELLQDTGVLGILDKLIVMQADWFVSGSRRCSRQRYVLLVFLGLGMAG